MQVVKRRWLNARYRSRQTEQEEESGPDPDFRVTYSRGSGWQVEIVSRHAHEWAKANAQTALFSNDGSRIRTDLAGVNFLVYQARSVGLRAEYIGPRRILPS